MIANPRSTGKKIASAAVKELPAFYSALGEKFSGMFASAPSMQRSKNGKGSITIKFASDAEAESLLKLLEEKVL